jgi:hypothetical protein
VTARRLTKRPSAASDSPVKGSEDVHLHLREAIGDRSHGSTEGEPPGLGHGVENALEVTGIAEVGETNSGGVVRVA